METADDYVQVAPNSTGEKVDMGEVRTLSGDTILRQRAELKGSAAEALLSIDATTKLQLAVLRAILFALTNGDVTEEQFLE